MELDRLRRAVANNLRAAGVPPVEILRGTPRGPANDIALFAAPREAFGVVKMGMKGDTNASHPKYAIARAAAEPERFKAPEARWIIDSRTSHIVSSPKGVANDLRIQYAVMLGRDDWSSWGDFTGVPNAGQLWGVDAVQLTGMLVPRLSAEALTMLAKDLYHDLANGRCVEHFVSVQAAS